MKLKTLRFLEQNRRLRSHKLKELVQPLKDVGITANHLTFLSFICGLIAIYYLFEDHRLFVIFGLIHLFFDSIDGVLARLTKITDFGKYFDFFTDRIITIALLTKTYLIVDESIVIIILMLTIITEAVYFFSDFQYPILFIRSTVMILFMLNIITVGYWVAGIISLYSIILQVNRYWELQVANES